MKVEILKLLAKLYERLTNEELHSFLSRAVGQLNPELTQDLMSVVIELIDYRDGIENGTLVKLPKIGDTVYLVKDEDGDDSEFSISDIGNTVFFTREEAEKKLKELKGENDEISTNKH